MISVARASDKKCYFPQHVVKADILKALFLDTEGENISLRLTFLLTSRRQRYGFHNTLNVIYCVSGWSDNVVVFVILTPNRKKKRSDNWCLLTLRLFNFGCTVSAKSNLRPFPWVSCMYWRPLIFVSLLTGISSRTNKQIWLFGTPLCSRDLTATPSKWCPILIVYTPVPLSIICKFSSTWCIIFHWTMLIVVYISHHMSFWTSLDRMHAWR